VNRIVFVAPQMALSVAPESAASALRRAAFQTEPGSDWVSWLANHLGIKRLPAAALAALPGEASTSVEPRGGKAAKPRVGGQGAQLLITEPAHLAVRNDGLVYMPIAPSGLTTNDASALVATLNHHFASEGLRFCVLSPLRWLVIANSPIDAQFVPGPLMPGASVFENLPVGADAKRFRRVMTEAQMLLHDHPVNQSRETRREPVVNSIWLWGEGALPTPPLGRYAHVVGDDPIAAGVALWMGASWSPRWPQNLPTGDVLVLTALADDLGGDLLNAAADAVARGARDSLQLILPGLAQTRVWHLSTADRFKFWRHAPLSAAELA
jgi:hypothetical protein